MILGHKPDARTLCAFFGRTIRQVGAAPRYLLSDKERMFRCCTGTGRQEPLDDGDAAMLAHGSVAQLDPSPPAEAEGGGNSWIP